MTMLDDPYLGPSHLWRRSKIACRPFITGESVRDWYFAESDSIAYPYNDLMEPQEDSSIKAMLVHLWPFRRLLELRLMFGKTQKESGAPLVRIQVR
jgi:hypothetical protein